MQLPSGDIWPRRYAKNEVVERTRQGVEAWRQVPRRISSRIARRDLGFRSFRRFTHAWPGPLWQPWEVLQSSGCQSRNAHGC